MNWLKGKDPEEQDTRTPLSKKKNLKIVTDESLITESRDEGSYRGESLPSLPSAGTSEKFESTLNELDNIVAGDERRQEIEKFLSRTQNELDESREMNRVLAQQLTLLQQEMKKFENADLVSSKKYDKMKQKLTSLTGVLEDLNMANQALVSKNKELEVQVKTQGSHNESSLQLKRMVGVLTKKIDEIQDEEARTRLKNTNLEIELAALNGVLDEAIKQTKLAQAARRDESKQKERLELQIAELFEDLEDMTDTSKEISHISTISKEIQEMDGQGQSDFSAEIRTKKFALQEKVYDLNRRLNEAVKEATQNDELAKELSELKNYKMQVDQLTKDKESLIKEQKTLEGEIAELTSSMMNASMQMSELKAKNERMDIELSGLQQQLEDANSGNDDRIKALEKANKDLQAKLFVSVSELEMVKKTLTTHGDIKSQNLLDEMEVKRLENEKVLAQVRNGAEKSMEEAQKTARESLVKVAELQIERDNAFQIVKDELMSPLEDEKKKLEKSHAEEMARMQEELKKLEGTKQKEIKRVREESLVILKNALEDAKYNSTTQMEAAKKDHNRKMQQLQEEKKELEDECKFLKDTTGLRESDMKQKLNRVQAEKNKLDKDILASEEKLAETTMAIDTMKKEQDELNLKHQNEVKFLNEEVAEFESKCMSLQETANSAQQELKEAKEKIGDHHQEMRALNDKVTEYATKCLSLQESAQSKESELQDLKKTTTELRDEEKKLREENNSLSQTIKTHEQKKAEAEKEVTELRFKLELYTEPAKLEKHMQEANDCLAEEIKELRASFDEKGEAYAQQKAEDDAKISNLESELSEAKKTIEAMKMPPKDSEQLPESTISSEKLQEIEAKHEAHLDLQKETISQLNSAKVSLEGEVSDLKAKLKDADAARDLVQSQSNSIDGTKGSVETKYVELEQSNKDLKQRIQVLQQQQLSENKNALEEIALLKSKLENDLLRQDKLNSVTEMQQDLEATIHELKRQNEELEQKNVLLQQEVSKSQMFKPTGLMQEFQRQQQEQNDEEEDDDESLELNPVSVPPPASNPPSDQNENPGLQGCVGVTPLSSKIFTSMACMATQVNSRFEMEMNGIKDMFETNDSKSNKPEVNQPGNGEALVKTPQEVTELQQKYESCRSQLEMLQNTNKVLEETIRVLEVQMETNEKSHNAGALTTMAEVLEQKKSMLVASTQIVELNAANAELETEIVNLKQKLDDANVAQEVLVTSLAQSRTKTAEFQKLQEQYDSLQARIKTENSTQRTSIENASAQISELNVTETALSTEIAGLKDQLQSSQQNNEDLTQEKRDLSTKNAQLVAEIAEVKTTLDLCQLDLADQKRSNKELTESLASAQKQPEKLEKSEDDETKLALDLCKRDLEHQKQTNQELKDLLALTELENKDMRADLELCQHDLQGQKYKTEVYQDLITKLNKMYEGKEDGKTVPINLVQDLERIEIQKAELSQSVATLQKKLEQATNDRDSARGEISILSAKVDELKKINEKSEKILNDLKATTKDKMRQLQFFISTLEKSNQEKANELEQLRALVHSSGKKKSER